MAGHAYSASSATGGARRCAIQHPLRRHAASARELRALVPSRRSISPTPRRHRGRERAAARRATGGLLRHQLPPGPAGSGGAGALPKTSVTPAYSATASTGSRTSTSRRSPRVGAHVADGRVIVAHLGNVPVSARSRGKERRQHLGFKASTGSAWAPARIDRSGRDPPPCPRRCTFSGPGRKVLVQAIGAARHLGYQHGQCATCSRAPIRRLRLAVDYFVYQARSRSAPSPPSLGGVGRLVFTAGIGERSVEIRRRICEASAWLGVTLDPNANAAHGPRITTAGSRVSAGWSRPRRADDRAAHGRACSALPVAALDGRNPMESDMTREAYTRRSLFRAEHSQTVTNRIRS